MTKQNTTYLRLVLTFLAGILTTVIFLIPWVGEESEEKNAKK